MVDIVKLGYSVNTSQVVKGDAAIDSLTASTLQADNAAKRLKGSQASLGTAMRSTTTQTNALGTAMRAAGGNTGRMLGQQLSQVAQQASATGNVLQAFTIQAADIGLAFGTIGIAAGIAITALGPLVGSFLDMESAAERMESQLDALDAAMGDIKESQDILTMDTRELSEVYGRYADRVREVATLQANLRIERLREEFASMSFVLTEAAGAFFTLTNAGRDYRNSLNRLERDFGVTREQAVALENQLSALATAPDFAAQQSELVALTRLMEQYGVEASQIPGEFRDALIEAIRLSNETDAAKAATDQLAESAAGISFSGAITGAQSLAAELGVSVALAQQLENIRNGLGANPANNNGLDALDPRNPNNTRPIFTGPTGNVSPFDPVRLAREARAAAGGRRGGGGGGGANREAMQQQREATRILDGLRTAQERYNDDIAQADRLLRAGALTQEAYNAHVANLQSELNDIEFAELYRGIDSVSDAIGGAIAQGQDLGETMRNVLQQIASDIISSGIKGLLTDALTPGPASGGGGFLGKLFAGFFDGGGTIPSGQFGVVGERGPELVSGPAQVTSRQDTARLMGGASEVVVRLGPGLEADILQKAQGQTVQIVGGAMRAQRSNLPGTVAAMQDRGA